MLNERWEQFHCGSKGKKYFISNLGRIKTINRSDQARLLKQFQPHGYLSITLRRNGIKKQERVHRLVAEYFVPNPHGFEIVDHIDTVTTNNKATNLRWVKDAKQNANNPTTLKRMSNSHQCKRAVLQIDRSTGRIIRIWDRPFLAHKELGFHSGNILRVCRGKRPSANGFAWRFLD